MGNFTNTEKLMGQLDLLLEINQCSLDKKSCEKMPTIDLKDMCKKLKAKNTFYSGIISNLKPELKCPIEPAVYNLNEVEVDFTMFSAFLHEGNLYAFNLKLIMTDHVSKKKRVIFCLNAEIKVVKTRVKS